LLCELLSGEVRVEMPVSEHMYAYLGPSWFEEGELSLATSGGRVEHPHFFSGVLVRPRQAAHGLLVVAEVARTRFFEPPGMLRARLLAADPVVTSNVDRLRFESFSACRGVYARFDLEPAALDGGFASWGTTNVDFNPPMRAALASVHDAESMLMHVGHEEVRVTTLAGSAFERRVPLPESWLKGFAEVQLASAGMVVYHELPAVEARRFLHSLPRTRGRGVAWATPAGRGLRLASRPDPAAVCLASPERLLLLARLLPFARSLRVYGPPAREPRGPEASAWELVMESARVVFVISPELYRGFSGEGNVLGDLAGSEDAVVEAVADHLHGEPAVDPKATAVELGLSPLDVQSALAVLGAAGRVGFDLSDGAYFHRELPFAREALEQMHPRLLGARQLVEEGAVILDADGCSANVHSGDVAYFVRFTSEGAVCTCAWFSRHRGERGPCKHLLAAEHARRLAHAG
jgi:hypothetical protein